MRISKLTINNFRCIKEQTLNSKELSIFIGDNATGKTSIIEAVNFALSPYFLSGRIKHTDFYNGSDEPIVIKIEFDENFAASLPDGYTSQKVECNGVYLEIKKRDKAATGKAFSDIVVLTHYVIPNRAKDNDNGWEIQRKSGTKFEFDERRLALSQAELEKFPKNFYFGKNRERQLQKGFNSSVSSIFDDFNWRFSKGVRDEEVAEGEEISTHSPYFFKNCLKNSQIELLITKNGTNGIVVENTGLQFGLFPWSPSWGEINYSAYGLPTIEFHNELYGYIQEKQQKYTVDQVETYFVGKSITKSKKWTKITNGQAQQPEDVTLLTFVRNSIHHPENTNNGGYTPQELKSSIDEMIKTEMV